MSLRARFDLMLLMPEVPNAHDACVARVESIIGANPGIDRAHVIGREDMESATLCLHYDPEVVSLRALERLAAQTAAQVTSRFGHAVLPIDVIAGEEEARRIESVLASHEGVLSAVVRIPAQQAHIEFDRELTNVEELREALSRATARGGQAT